MANSTTPLPPKEELNGLIGLGYLISTVARMPNLTMIELIPHLLKYPSVANEMLQDVLPPPLVEKAGIQGVLQQINDVLPRLPRDELWSRINILYIIILIVALVVVALRFYVRLAITPKRLRAEDWVCFATLVSIVIWIGTLFAQNAYGYTGQHVYLLTIKNIRAWNIYNTMTGSIFTACHGMVKYTFLVFYYRLYPNKPYHVAVWAVGIYITGVTISSFLVFAFQCNPRDFWNHLYTAKCIDRKMAWTLQGCWYILADFMILTLPIPVLFKLQLKIREKLLLVGVFGLGSFISIISIIRLLALREWLENADFTYAFGKHVMWASSEIVLSLVVACAPALKVLVFHRSDSDRSPSLSKLSFTAGGLFRSSYKRRGSESKNNHVIGATTQRSERKSKITWISGLTSFTGMTDAGGKGGAFADTTNLNTFQDDQRGSDAGDIERESIVLGSTSKDDLELGSRKDLK